MSAAPASRLQLVLAYTAIYLLWGGSYLAIRWAVTAVPPAIAMGPRNLIGGIVLIACALAWRTRPLTRMQFGGSIAIGLLYFALSHGLLATAQRHVPTGVAALLFAAVPLWITLFDSILRRRIPRWPTLLGLVTGFAGIAVLMHGRGGGSGAVDPLWGLMTLASGMVWATGTVVAVRTLPGSNPVRAAAVQLIVGGAGLTLFAAVSGDLRGFTLDQVTLRAGIGFAYLLLAGTFVSFVAFNWLMAREPATRVATYAFVNPAVAVLIGWAVEGEALNTLILVAMLMIIGAVALIVLERREPRAAG
ncbi:MAG: EamA family transporter [Alphaproteobacteria bacterium]|nr:EamA family transporter [Alphaproteobacteria bacterium]